MPVGVVDDAVKIMELTIGDEGDTARGSKGVDEMMHFGSQHLRPEITSIMETRFECFRTEIVQLMDCIACKHIKFTNAGTKYRMIYSDFSICFFSCNECFCQHLTLAWWQQESHCSGNVGDEVFYKLTWSRRNTFEVFRSRRWSNNGFL